MIKCEKCGYENKDDAIYCESCNEILLKEIYFPFKNKWLAVLLSFIGGLVVPLHGLGNVYLGFWKRFLVEFPVGLITTVIINFLIYDGLRNIAIYPSIFLILWWIFTIYDTYNCANAINYARDIPKLFGRDIR